MSQDQEMKNSASESVFFTFFLNCYSREEEAKLINVLPAGLIPQNIIESGLLVFLGQRVMVSLLTNHHVL